MFVIESEQMNVGGMVEWEQNYRLRHLTSHSYLSLGANINQIDNVTNRRLKLEKEVQKSDLFQF